MLFVLGEWIRKKAGTLSKKNAIIMFEVIIFFVAIFFIAIVGCTICNGIKSPNEDEEDETEKMI